MSLIFEVEDGTGKADATSYATLAAFRQYWENRGIDYSDGGTPGATDTEISIWLNTATSYIDMNYRFFGARTNDSGATTPQALQWPRKNVLDRDGNEIASDSLPIDIANACIELARVVKDNSDLYADESANIESQSLGPASVTYKKGVRIVSSQQKAALVYLKPYLMGGTLLVNRV